MVSAGYWFVSAGYWLLPAGYWLDSAGYWLDFAGYWLVSLVTGSFQLVGAPSRRVDFKSQAASINHPIL